MDDDLDDYKLDTSWGQDLSYVVHASFEKDRRHGGRKVRVENKWFRRGELGVGSCGVVNLESTEDGRERAVKTIRKSMATRLKIDYRRELAAISTFSKAKYQQHQIFVEFLGWFENLQFIFLAMEYFPLGDLSKHISGEIEEYELKDISSQLLEGLYLMHSKGFTHRDLKPQNIFVVQIHPSWWVKIGDFGISKRVRDCDTTELRTVTGTQGYEAPEIRGYIEVDEDEPSSVYTNVVDVWSFGCVIYKVIAKRVPFQDGREIKRFCDNRIPFPAQPLQGKMTTHGIDFLQSILIAKPSDRPSVEIALKHPWLLHDDQHTNSSLQHRLALADRKEHTKAATEKTRQEEEEELERPIVEMEEAELLREKQEAQVLARRAAEKIAVERGGIQMGTKAKAAAVAAANAVLKFGAVNNTSDALPAGVVSEEPFAMYQDTIPRPTTNLAASFNHPSGTFPNNNPTTRIPSGSDVGSMGPLSSFLSESEKIQRRKRATQRAQAAKTMPLTAGQEVQPIQVSATSWKPLRTLAQLSATGVASLAPRAGNGHMEPEMVQRKVQAALNKMTPEKFDTIANQILAIVAQSKNETDGRTLRKVIQLTFEMAINEMHWASLYAKLCKRMLETMSPDIKDETILDRNGDVVSGGNLFRKYLINRCQEEFERSWRTDLGEKASGKEGDEKSTEAAMLSDQRYIAGAVAKQRGLGLFQFLGELYKLGMLTERIMHECLKSLVDYTDVPDEAEIEILTKFLKIIGGSLDSTERGRPMMDVYFLRIQTTIELPELPNRLKFMLMDIVDFRKKNWHLKDGDKGHETLKEVRADAVPG